MTELNPCPFCGSSNVVVFATTGGSLARIGCVMCGVSTEHHEHKEAVARWNARTAAQDERLGRLVDALGPLLSDNGCDCPCEHSAEEHDGDCDRCLACRIDAELRGVDQ